jgi:2-phospho-L-lactate/phosphoenolpyruvate guanylyltransferase
MPVVFGSGWTALVPVKRLALAKTRLRGAVPGTALDALVLAMAMDTVSAALACPRVRRLLVITDDPLGARALAALGAECLPDEPAGGLNVALEHGASHARATGAPARGVGGAGVAVVALTADLPALRPAELSAALEAAERASGVRAYAPDAGGSGTVLLTAQEGAPLLPRFGAGSAAAHAASGAVALRGDWPSLQRDVDTAADLAAATALGLGPHTAAALGAPRYGGPMQATVASFEPVSGAGTVLLDDGSELEFPAEAFARSGLRLLRLGQRVRLDQDGAGQITRLTLPTFP